MMKTKNVNMSKNQYKATIPKIKELVEKHYREDIDTDCRRRELVYMRAIFYKLCKENTKTPLDKIGDCVNRNHATVISGIRIFDEVLSTQEPYEWIETYNALDLIVKQKLEGKDIRVETLRELLAESIKENLELRERLNELSKFESQKTMI